jgi:predicted ribosomally synthesized peptide with nif11-like leader
MPNNRMQPDFGKLRLPQPLMRTLCGFIDMSEKWANEMSIEAIQEFYKATFTDETLQKRLIVLTELEDFIETAVIVGKENGYEFTINEMHSTMDGYGPSDTFKDEEFESKWVEKILEIGWVPLGYSR